MKRVTKERPERSATKGRDRPARMGRTRKGREFDAAVVLVELVRYAPNRSKADCIARGTTAVFPLTRDFEKIAAKVDETTRALVRKMLDNTK